jgi:hypothetical protein
MESPEIQQIREENNALRRENERLIAEALRRQKERRQDALDGQATLDEQASRINDLENELGELYALIFRDGGQKQAALDAMPPVELDIFQTGTPPKPRRYFAAIKAIWDAYTELDLRRKEDRSAAERDVEPIGLPWLEND